jgi:hypothetical protein
LMHSEKLRLYTYHGNEFCSGGKNTIVSIKWSPENAVSLHLMKSIVDFSTLSA